MKLFLIYWLVCFVAVTIITLLLSERKTKHKFNDRAKFDKRIENE